MILLRSGIRLPSFLRAHMNKGLGRPSPVEKATKFPIQYLLLLGMIQLFTSHQ
jgi:hypothetical protein